MYIYEKHTGGAYLSNQLFFKHDLYCPKCNDSDRLIGCARNNVEAKEVIISHLGTEALKNLNL